MFINLNGKKLFIGLNEASEKVPLWSLHNPISLNHLLCFSKKGSAFLVFEYSTPEGKKLLAGE